VAGRALAFSDPEIVKMATEDYVAVACDDWYMRRRQDAEGQFFRDVSGRGPRAGGSTRQGIYMFTAGGTLLGFKNAGQAPDVMRDTLRDALHKFKNLPEAERAPGAVKVPDPGPLDGGYDRKPPPGGLIVKVYARALDRKKAGGGTGAVTFADAVCEVGSGDEASRDHLWLTEAEWRSLIPADAKKGARTPLPPAVAQRVLRFHLVDNLRGEPPMWEPEHVRSSDLSLVVESATPAGVRLRLEGSALLSTDADTAKADRGYDVAVLGYIEYDRKADRIKRFDVAAVGEHWGEGGLTGGARPGRTPLGVAFELSQGDGSGDTVPPQAARDVYGYFATGAGG
jgi:hypothetical protein